MNEYVQTTVDLLNWFDWGIVTIIGISTLYGLFRGFIKEAVTVTAWALAAWVSYFYAEPLSTLFLEAHISTASMRVALMILALFIVILASSSLIRSAMNFVIQKSGLMGLDYVLGGLFGFARGILLSILLIIILLNLGFSRDPWWNNAHMVKKLTHVMEMLSKHLPEDSKDIYVKYALPKKKNMLGL